ncbi:MAG TPA: hypothetical protein VJ722_05530, partial [Rhodanobacteraceae bacterium]|nr:hypothetical protein [Rhodanobacteraceae bacterium]
MSLDELLPGCIRPGSSLRFGRIGRTQDFRSPSVIAHVVQGLAERKADMRAQIGVCRLLPSFFQALEIGFVPVSKTLAIGEPQPAHSIARRKIQRMVQMLPRGIEFTDRERKFSRRCDKRGVVRPQFERRTREG